MNNPFGNPFIKHGNGPAPDPKPEPAAELRLPQAPPDLPPAPTAEIDPTAWMQNSLEESLLWKNRPVADSERVREEEVAGLINRVHQRLLEWHDPKELYAANPQRLAEIVSQAVDVVRQSGDIPISSRLRERLHTEVCNELNGYGPLQPLLDDGTVTEVMVNGPEHVFVERKGKIEATERRFLDNNHVMRVIERIIAPLGRRVDETSPMVDARLPDGSRVNIIIPPLSLKGPVITIRKFGRKALQAEDMVRFGSLTPGMLHFLRAAVGARLNILISGGTGSGKTSTLNVLSSFIGDTERIITVEDAAEVQLQQQHVITLEGRPQNVEGKGEITIRMLVRNCLRMRPDRIIVGEVRGAEALDMLQAMNTGHDGSLSTLHSNAPRDSLARLEVMVLMAGMDLPVRAIREQIASAIHLVVHQNRLRDGTRRITHITEVQGLEGEVVALQDIFRWQQRGVDAEGKVLGAHLATGLRPRCVERMAEQGIELPQGLFDPSPGMRV